MQKDILHSRIIPFLMIISINMFLIGNFLRIPLIDNPISTVIFGVTFLSIIFVQISYLKRQIKTIAKKNIALESAGIQREEFIALASHNFRTPIMLIKENCELLKKNQKFQEKAKTPFKIITENADKLNHLINQAISIHEMMNTNELIKKRFNVKDAIKKIVKDSKLRIKAKNISIKITGDARINANENKIVMLLDTLIDNAIKFSKKEGHLSMNIIGEGKNAKIVIKDNGIGISKQKLNNLFALFNRGTSALNYDYEGAGLGLFTAKKVIDAHNGTIHIQSSKKNGTTVTITLPI